MNRQQRRLALKQATKSSIHSVGSLSEFDIAIHHFQNGRVLQAEASCRAVLSKEISDVHGLHRLGLAAHHFKRHGVAADLLRRAVSLRPADADLYISLAETLKDLGKFDEAVCACYKSIAVKQDFAEAYNALGRVHHEQRLIGEAVAAYKKAILLDAKCAAARVNLGLLLFEQGQVDAAFESFREAIRIKPDFVEAHRKYAYALRQYGRLDDASECLRHALAFNAQEHLYYADLAVIYIQQGRHLEAVDACKKALKIKSDDAGTLANLGNSLHDLGQVDEAISAYKLAIKLDPSDPTFFSNLGSVYGTTGRPKEAIAAFRGALALTPQCVKSLTGLYQQRRAICDWQGLEYDEATILTKLRSGEKIERIPPFGVLGMSAAAPRDQLCAAALWAEQYYPLGAEISRPTGSVLPRGPNRRIRIGYLSADYFNHATAFLISELIERHDRSRFEIFGYSYGPDDRSPVRRRLVNAFDHFVELQSAAHADAAQRINDDAIDILVDLKGYTRDARTEILAYKPAPIQVNYLGYPGTMGASFIDYIIGDPIVTPLNHQSYYSEKIVQLPDSYQPNDTKRQIADVAPTRSECGLPDHGFVFCCFNNTYKITSEIFETWMRLLKAVPDSVFWLLEANDKVKENLSREAKKHSVDPARLVFAKRVPVPDHLARHRHADLFLDTVPVNAHTTASDALWAGVPVVTCVGNSFVARVAASLVTAVGLPELVAHSLREYESLALRLATDTELLSAVKMKLSDTRLANPLFDIERYTRNLERAYIHMHEILVTGGSPRPFAVSDLSHHVPLETSYEIVTVARPGVIFSKY